MPLRDNWHPSSPSGQLNQRQRGLLEDIWRLHVAFTSEQWLWRGHWCCNWTLTPGIVSRRPSVDSRVPTLEQLLGACRFANLDADDGVRLPDLALMARLQHQGAATALLDVTTDPAVALFMAATPPPGEEPRVCCDEPAHASNVPDGLLVAIQRPAATLEPFDPRPLADVVDGLEGGLAYYEPPPIDHRLRIQRGAFLLHDVRDNDEPPLAVTPKQALEYRMDRNNTGRTAVKQVCVFRVQGALKESLRAFLSSRAGLTREAIYPSAFDRPHLEQFAVNHSRASRIP